MRRPRRRRVTVTSRVIRSSTVVVAGDDPVDRRRRGRPRSASARKPTWPRLTPSSGVPAGAGQLGGAQQRAVAAEHDHQLAAVGGLPSSAVDDARRPSRPQVGGLVGEHPDADAGRARTARRRARDRRQRLRPAGVRRRAGRVRPRSASRGPSATARVEQPPGPAAARPARSHRKYSTLPAGPGSGLAVTPATPSPSARAPPRRPPRTASARSAGLAHDAAGAEPLLPDLELRLDHQHQVGVRRRRQRTRAGSTSRSEMNDRSATTRSTGVADRCRGSGRGRWCGRGP